MDYLNLTRMSCCYCTHFDHATEHCPTILEKIGEKGAQPPQLKKNLQIMMVEPCEEDPKVNIMLRSGTTMRENEGKQLAEVEWVRKESEKETGFYLECPKETIMEEKKSFTEASTQELKRNQVKKWTHP